MARPSINTAKSADQYADKRRERIAEFTTPSGKGGLISIRQNDDGTVSVHLYRLDAGITVTSSAD